MEIERRGRDVRVTDEASKTVRVRLPGFESGDVPFSVADAIDATGGNPETATTTIEGETHRVQCPPVHVTIVSMATNTREDFGNGCQRLSIGEGSYLARFDASVRVYVRFDGPATLRRTDADLIELGFPTHDPVSVCFESRVDRPDHTVTVPKSPAGVARAVSACTATITTTTPDRTWPTQRKQPPAFAFGDTTHVPRELREARSDTGIRLTVPPTLRWVFTVAPLAQYLGARVVVERDATPGVAVGDRWVSLGAFPTAEQRIADLLQRVFFLDCAARAGGPHSGPLSVEGVLDEVGLDAETLYDTPLAERVRTYLDVSFDAVRGEFPDWHLAMYVEPTYDHARTLPYLLRELPIIQRPRSEPLSKQDLLSVTVGDGYNADPTVTASDDTVRGRNTVSDESTRVRRDRTDEPTHARRDRTDEPTHARRDRTDEPTRVRREISDVNLVNPELIDADTHGWMADGVPINVFKTFPAAYRNRFEYLDDDSRLRVIAVVNEREMPMLLSENDSEAMYAEHAAAVDQYERRGEELPIDIEVRENVTTAELARIFESRNDFVHFIGHRDDAGLECSNGYLSTSSIDRSRTQTFFLNACGSYPEGRELVTKGSVAGGITYERVSDNDAATVGTTLARLVMFGYSIERAVRKASRQLLTPKDYAVVGDGTHVVTQSDAIIPPDIRVIPDGDDEFTLTLDQQGPRMWLIQTQGTFDDDYHLPGTGRTYPLSRTELLEYLDVPDSPIVYDGELYWPEELRELLQ